MDDTPGVHADERRALDRRILSLAVPALGALVAEPLFVLIDSAVVGRLGTAELAGLTIASTVLVTIVSIFIFLAYATTGAVARRLGAGDTKGALAVGLDGIWLALGLGAVTCAVAIGVAEPIVTALGASADVTPHAVAYLRSSAPGIPGMLVVLAATGALRGLQDTRTPLVVAVVGAVVNTIGSITLVYGFHMGIAGSGLATALTQLGMGAVLAAIVLRGARARGVGLRPHPAGIMANARAGTPLLIRTLTLRAAILLTVATATKLGDATLAAHQIVNAVWGLTAFALDALAIAAQALVGHGLGARDVGQVRAVTRRCLQWGMGAGAVIGVAIAGLGWLVTPLFTSDPQVQRAAAISLVVIGLLLPLAAWPFVLDGVLMGAGDGRFLAWAGVITLVTYLPMVGAVWLWAPDGAAGLAWLWVAFAGGFIGARAITTGLRARGTAWMVLGA
ncbi:MATE family efflux transporter [Occultella kanbiaonis]|uniref:MATE family efflux transporter n=1 Tax=Occultella kanbiaonis TaxID=2675754 RepID=UPI0012B70A7B|nr:MATE family efflux transporter [Occultella kanbiaonis]